MEGSGEMRQDRVIGDESARGRGAGLAGGGGAGGIGPWGRGAVVLLCVGAENPC